MIRSAEAFPWDEVLAFLLGVLGWAPRAVWAATIPDIRHAIEGRLGRTRGLPPDAAAIAALMAAFPDTVPQGCHDER